MNPYVNLSIKNKVGIIDFYHPKSNSLPEDLLGQLTESIRMAGERDDIQVVILISGGDQRKTGTFRFNPADNRKIIKHLNPQKFK